jgi:hypothetical protein
VLNVVAGGAALAGTFFIIWNYGLAEFAFYTISMAKLSLILLGIELLPGNFTIFRLQDDERFTQAVPVFYLGFAVIAAAAAAGLIATGLVDHFSWFMIAFVFASAMQVYFDTQAQASGRVGAFFWIPAASNIARLVLLVGLALLKLPAPDVLWGSVAIGSIIGQAVMITHFPEFLHPAAYRNPLAKLRYLLSIRSAYYAYYVNSLLKRLRDTFLPLFCDLAMPSKAEIGRLLVFVRAIQAVARQVRILEAYMINRTVRDDLRHLRRRIFWTIGPLGHACVAAIALVLIYRHGIEPLDWMLAFVAGLFLYPYIAELFWRNDALASFRPRQVTISLSSFLIGLAAPSLIAWQLGYLGVPVLLVAYVFGQALSAATYRLFPRAGRSRTTREPAR